MYSPWAQKDHDALRAISLPLILYVGFCSIAVTSGWFFILDEVPTFNFVLLSISMFLLLASSLILFKPKAGDDQ